MAIARSAFVTKVRVRLADRTTRRDGTAITTTRYPNADIQTAIDDALRDRQSDIETIDPTFYLSVFDFIGRTNAIAASSSVTLPVVAYEQYAAPTGFKKLVRLDRKSTRLNSSHLKLSRMPSSA